MPELPEVEYIRRLLRPAMEGWRIRGVLVRRPALRYPLGADFVARLRGKTVTALRRRAKYLVAELASEDVLVMHLGMSGWFRVVRRGGPSGPQGPQAFETHDHVVFEMSSGATVIYSDYRRFGFMKVMPRSAFANDLTMRSLGPEPLDRSFDAAALARALRGRKTTIKAALLDQRIVAGLGNIYAAEALHRARISPARQAGTLVSRTGEPQPGLRRLVPAIRQALEDAIAHQHRAGGSDRFRVYDRESLRCTRRGCSGVVRRIVQSGRSTFYCPACQR